MQALGFIEVVGKVAAIEAADICLKSANVKLIGYELTNGALVTVKVEGDVGAVKSAIDAAKASVVVQGKLVATLVIPRPAKGISSMVESEVIKEVVSQSNIQESENDSKSEGEEEFSNKIENKEEILECDEANTGEPLEFNKLVNEDISTSEEISDENKSSEKVENDDNKNIELEETNSVMNISSIKSDNVQSIIDKNEEINNLDDELVEEGQQSENKEDISCNLCRDPICSRKRGQPKNLCIHYKDKIENFEGDIRYEVK